METLLVDRGSGDDAGIVTITLNRPKSKNAITKQMWAELFEVFSEIYGRSDDRVVVLTGSANEFSSGADLWSDAGSGPPRHGYYNMRNVTQAVLALHRLPQPTIAKVPGVAAGAGCNLALGCDLIVASERARFSEIFAARGLSVDGGGAWLLPRLVGLHKAKEIALFADILSAEEAERFGIVNRVVPNDELDAFVTGWARRLAAGPPIAYSQTKRLLNESYGYTMEQALDAEGAAQTVNFSTRDTAEAIGAWAEKRAPKLEGR
jgi:enoyl-CoA hydratase/carnithine racemase